MLDGTCRWQGLPHAGAQVAACFAACAARSAQQRAAGLQTTSQPAEPGAHQYMSRMGQKTGTSNMGKKVAQNPSATALALLHLQCGAKGREEAGSG